MQKVEATERKCGGWPDHSSAFTARERTPLEAPIDSCAACHYSSGAHFATNLTAYRYFAANCLSACTNWQRKRKKAAARRWLRRVTESRARPPPQCTFCESGVLNLLACSLRAPPAPRDPGCVPIARPTPINLVKSVCSRNPNSARAAIPFARGASWIAFSFGPERRALCSQRTSRGYANYCAVIPHKTDLLKPTQRPPCNPERTHNDRLAILLLRAQLLSSATNSTIHGLPLVFN